MSNPNCKKCPLWEGALHVCIDGRGNKNAKFLVVGQNPGMAENMAGTPFIGRSGKMLIDLFKEAGFEGSELRFTNAVRCLTPANRAPETEEINACREYLINEVRSVNPAAIIALGDVALRALCRTSGISQRRGTSLKIHDDFNLPELEVWPTYHPAFILRSPNYRQVVIDDLRRVRNSFNAPQKIEWQEWAGQLPEGETLAYDIETSYYIDGGDRIIQLQVASSGGVVVARTPEAIRSCVLKLTYAATHGKVIVGHNSFSFDVPRLEGLLHEAVGF